MPLRLPILYYYHIPYRLPFTYHYHLPYCLLFLNHYYSHICLPFLYHYLLHIRLPYSYHYHIPYRLPFTYHYSFPLRYPLSSSITITSYVCHAHKRLPFANTFTIFQSIIFYQNVTLVYCLPFRLSFRRLVIVCPFRNRLHVWSCSAYCIPIW